MSLSKLLILVVCCLVLAYSVPLLDLDCDKLSEDSFCQPYGTAWWRKHAKYCFTCGNKVYHCARDYDNPKVHREGCAAEKNCSAGEEPHLSFIKNGQPLTEPIVYCNPCYDRNYFNRESRRSSTYSECPYEKRNDCSSDKHKIFCETEDLTDERYCRCDARKGFSPINDFSYVKCSYKDYECLDDYKCPNLANGKAQQMLLNYTCAAVCDDGYDRLSEDSDECLLKTTVATSQKPTTIVPPIPERNKTTDSARIPAPASTQIPTCSEECDQFSTCHNGTCECLDDACSDPYEPVCGYDEKSQKYRTFNSSCELNRAYCRQKQFVFHSDGECKTAVPGETNDNSSTITVIFAFCASLVFVLLILGIFCHKNFKYIGRKHKDTSCPGPVISTNIDDSQLTVRLIERILRAPLSKQEDSSSPALQRSNSQTRGYKGDVKNGENVRLLEDEFHANTTVANDETNYKEDEKCKSVTIIDASTLCKDNDEYKKLINEVMDQSYNYLIDNMNPYLILDSFYTKGILEYKTKRDITDLVTQSAKSRELIRKIRETGRQYYQKFKHCLKETKQDSCLAKVEQIQSDVIKKMKTKAALSEPNRRRRNSSNSESLPNHLDNLNCEKLEMIPNNFLSSDDGIKVLPKVQSGKTQAQKQNERLPGASLLPPLEETIEQEANIHLKDIGSFLKNKDFFKILNIDKKYKEFARICEEIRTKFPELTAERLLQQLLAGTQHTFESYSYTNTPSGFQACRSSGNDNSCLYQSISLLLTGSENSQCSLRLLATLHAVESFSVYKELLHHSMEECKSYFHSLIDEQTIMDLNELDDDDTSLVDAFLKLLIMETACLGTDSGVLHVEFLSGALGIKIVQYFQHETGYGRKRGTKPLAKVKRDEETKSSLRLPDLYIFWVNSSNTENGTLNHIVPLFPVGNDSEAIHKRVS